MRTRLGMCELTGLLVFFLVRMDVDGWKTNLDALVLEEVCATGRPKNGKYTPSRRRNNWTAIELQQILYLLAVLLRSIDIPQTLTDFQIPFSCDPSKHSPDPRAPRRSTFRCSIRLRRRRQASLAYLSSALPHFSKEHSSSFFILHL